MAIRVLITGAAGQIAYSLIPFIAKGDVFGSNQPVILHLLDIPAMIEVLEGVAMEIRDCAFPLVEDVFETTVESDSFINIDVAFLIGTTPQEGMEKKDLLSANVEKFASYGRALAAFAYFKVKALVVGDLATTNALICAHFAAPQISSTEITAVTRLDQNRVKSELSQIHKVPVESIQNVITWGNHSSTHFPDIKAATINGQPLPFSGHDQEFIKQIQTRGAAVIAAGKLSSAMSTAKAAADHMKDWWQGTSDVVSMGVISDDNCYNVPNGLVFSFPVTVDPETKQWKIVEGFEIDDFAREKLTVTAKELEEERAEAMAVTQSGNQSRFHYYDLYIKDERFRFRTGYVYETYEPAEESE